VALAICLLVPAAVADARQIGSTLRNPPNARGFDCTIGWLAGFGVTSSGQRTCTWFTVGQINSFGTGFGSNGATAPSTGRITGVSIRSQANPARLRVSIVRQITTLDAFGNFVDTACCFGQRQSGAFRPRPNRVSTFDVNLPVEVVTDPANGVAWTDYVAISALGGGTLPIFSQGAAAHENSLTPGAYQSRAIWPRVQPNEERVDGFGQSGFEVLARFEFHRRR
jgi:hypothetical protein